MKKSFEPNFRTPEADWNKNEINKLNSGITDHLANELRDLSRPDIILEAEQVAKSHGIYLEFDRAKTGEEKDWRYMIRISIPGGGPINKAQWQVFDELSDKYTVSSEGQASLRFTTRQNIQFHWLKKNAVVDVVKTIAEKGLNSLNGCGDNTRNVMGCPLSRYSDIFNAHAWSHKAADFFQLPLKPFIEIFAIDPNYLRVPEESYSYGPKLLNRKFKIAFSAVHRDFETGQLVMDNCVELRTNDLGVAPIVEKDKVVAFQLYIGGGQGQKNSKTSIATLGEPLCISTEAKLLEVLNACVKVHEEWGDRQNRHWARIKYLIKKQGVDWFRQQLNDRLGYQLQKPNPDHDYGARQLHFGWSYQPTNKLWAYGAYLENGRVSDHSPNGKLKTLIGAVLNKYNNDFMVTPNQDVLFMNIPGERKEEFVRDLESFGYGKRNGKPYSKLRTLSGACVGRDTCRLTYTDSEKFEPELLDELEKMGWGNMAESIGITGCEAQCFRPATKAIGLVGTGLNRYQLKLFGDETARFQGRPLIASDGQNMYLRSIPRELVAVVVDTLFKFYQARAKAGEGLGDFNRRLGPDVLIEHFKNQPATAALMEKPFHTDWEIA